MKPPVYENSIAMFCKKEHPCFTLVFSFEELVTGLLITLYKTPHKHC